MTEARTAHQSWQPIQTEWLNARLGRMPRLGWHGVRRQGFLDKLGLRLSEFLAHSFIELQRLVCGAAGVAG